MAEDSSRRGLLRQALSLDPKTRRKALSALVTSRDVLPTSFLPHLIARISTTDQCSLQFSIRLITASLSSGADTVVKKKITTLAMGVRYAPLPTRDALNLAKFSAALLNSTVRDAAIDLLVASIAATEASAVPKSGPQRRSQSKALRTAYRHGGRNVAACLQFAAPLLFTIADHYAKTARESVASLGLLAPSFEKLSVSDQERFLVLLATICVKTSLVSSDLAQMCQRLVESVDTNVLVSKVVPVLDRALLREPQTALPSSTQFLKIISQKDMSSASGKGFVPAIVQAVKSSEHKTRLHAVALAGALGPCLLSDESVREAIEALLSVLKNARYAYQKVATLDAISAVTCSSLGARTSIEVAARDILGWLSSRKESNEEARLSGIQALVKLANLACKRKADGAELPETFLKCATYFADTLGGKGSESDMRSLLIALTDGVAEHHLPRSFIGDAVVSSLESFVTKPSTKKRQEECLRALTLLVDFDTEEGYKRILSRESKAWRVFGDQKSSPVLQDTLSRSNLCEIKCAIRCCSWMVRVEHESSSSALTTLFSLSVDTQPATCTEARSELQRLHKHGDAALISKMFLAMWETFFSASEADRSIAKSRDFDDGMVFAEKLGHTLLATVLPGIPLELLHKILLAANHPRLLPQPEPGRLMPRSRFWSVIQKGLEPVDVEYSADGPEDWLESCLSGIFGNDGLRSKTPAGVQAAVNSLHALASKRNPYSTRVLRRAIVLLRPLVSGSAALGPEDFEALETVKQASQLSESTSLKPDGGRLGHKRANKKQVASNPRMDQQRQAAADRARAAAANASLVAEKAKAVEAVASAALEVLRLSRAALPAIAALARSAPEGVRSLMASMLSLVLPLGRLEPLEGPCRETLYALTETISKRLYPIAVDVASSLYGLERRFDVKDRVSRIIYALDGTVPPALEAEDFSLISPLIRAAMLRDPNAEDQGIMSGRRGSTKRRDTIALVKAAAQVLLEHCKPEAVDAAVAAAGCRAGSWAVRVLEREDGAFATAADALALLTGTALNPGTDALSQVLEGIISGKSSVRDAALAALARLPPLASANVECPRDPALGRSLWLCRFDPDEANAELADELWTNYNHPLHVPDDVPAMLGLLAHVEVDIRLMSAKAIAAALCGNENEGTRNICIPQMFTLYLKKLPQAATPLEKGRPGTKRGSASGAKRGLDRTKMGQEEEVDPGWAAREGVALAIGHLATAGALALKDITVSFSFLAGRGLGDENDKVREKMSKAAVAVVEAAGEQGPSILLPMIEKQLNLTFSSSASSEEVLHADRTRENLVMCLGSVASFLPPDDARVEKIANQVMKSAMETPSEVVQNAAARCLVPLAQSAIGGKREEEIARVLLQTVWNEESTYGERRGAAYALAGISKGLGLKFMKKVGIMMEIEAAVGEKAPRRRQGAFLLIETHALLLERLFEPYAVSIVPFLLQCMGDSVIEVRNSCWAAAQASMSEISSLGVKMILPSLLEGLKDRQWRTKAGSAEVLGAMAYCAPRQLAQCLPQVVPKLAEALADAHPKVVSAAESAISRIAAVVRSPEVRKLSPFLLAALRDPAGKTRGAVDAMLGSHFVHAIDAASLALLIPPLHRGLRDRSSELKKRSAAIVGSMCNHVANHSDVVPYLDLLLPSLRVTLLDAIPDVRRTSARALGALAVSLGETGLPDIVPWLVNAILRGARTPVTGTRERQKLPPAIISSSAERSGAAMGLAEVSASMSERRLEEVLDNVLKAGQLSAEAREGGLMLIAAMPKALGERFEGRLARALSAVLKGLADDADSVREAALEAGRNLVSAYAKSSLDNILPELLSAMQEKLWRIRQAATRLLGDLLLVIAGGAPERPDIFGSTDVAGNDIDTVGQGSDQEGGDENEDKEGEEGGEEELQFESPEHAAAAMSTEAAMKVIEEVLGFERRNEVLAALYIIRCDVSIRVRQTGIQVWKSVVANTPRVLREIMPCAVRQIVDGLGDEDEERRAAAGKTLSDLSQKLGERVVPEVLPALRTGISNKEASPRIRRGACEGLSELVQSSTKEQLVDYAGDLIDAVYQGLSDDLSAVRMVAAEVFAYLLKPLGTAVVDSIIPKLIARLSGEAGSPGDAEVALDSLKQIMRSSGTRLLAIVVPRLLAEKPLKPAGSRVLAAAALVAESSFEPYIVDVVTGVIESIEVLDASVSLESFEGILAAIANSGDKSVKLMLDDIFDKFNEGYPEKRIAASGTIIAYCHGVSQEQLIASCVPLLERLIRQLADIDDAAAKAAWEALKVLSDTVPCSDLSPHIPIIRQSLKAAATGISVTDSETKISGLQIPKAPAPFVPIFSDGLLNGSPELREQAALAIAELIELTNSKSLGPFVIKFTGPLIRVVSGRFPWQVKAAILRALLLLLKNGGPFLRPFAPQLQSAFVKSLSDNSRLVRVRACAALGALVPIQPRLEALLNDLVSLGISGGSAGSRTAAFHSCSQVLRLGKKLPESTFTSILESMAEGLSDDDDDVSKATGRALGFLASRSADSAQYVSILSKVHSRLDMEDAEYTDRASAIRAIGYMLVAGKGVKDLTYYDVEPYATSVFGFFNSAITHLQCAACTTAANLFSLMTEAEGMKDMCISEKRDLVMQLAERAEFDDNPVVRIAALNALKDIVRLDDLVLELCTATLIVCAGATNTGIRDAADRVLRKGLLNGRDLVIDGGRIEIAKDGLTEEDQRFIDRRIPKLRNLPESDEEKD